MGGGSLKEALGSADDCCLDQIEEIVKRLVRHMQMFERDHIAVYGFTTAQYYTLLELKNNRDLTMNELSLRLNIASSTASRIVDKLVQNGYIQRVRSEIDRRVVEVSLTSEGQETVQKIHQNVSRFYRATLNNIPEDDLDTVLSSIRILMKAFEKANPACC